jgi:hypothetical protein
MESITKLDFQQWVLYHMSQFPQKGWAPYEIATPEGVMIRNPDWINFARGWYAAVTEIGATVEELNAATVALLRTPPAFLDAHLPAIENAVKLFRQRQKSKDADQAAVETAGKKGDEAYHPDLSHDVCRSRSRNCPECGGGGLAMRYVQVEGLPYATRGTLFCRCPMGRWMLEHYKLNHRELYVRIADLQSHPDLWNHPGLTFDAWAQTPTPYEEGKAGAMVAGHFLAPTELGGYPVASPGEGVQAVVDTDAPEDYPEPPRRYNDEDDDEPPFDVPPPIYNPND